MENLWGTIVPIVGIMAVTLGIYIKAMYTNWQIKKAPTVRAVVKSCTVSPEHGAEDNSDLYDVVYEYQAPDGNFCTYTELEEKAKRVGSVFNRKLVKHINGYYLYEDEVRKSNGAAVIFPIFGGIVSVIVFIASIAQSEDPATQRVGIIIMLFIGALITGCLTKGTVRSIKNKEEDLERQTKAIRIKRRQKSIKQDKAMLAGFAIATIVLLGIAGAMIAGIL